MDKLGASTIVSLVLLGILTTCGHSAGQQETFHYEAGGRAAETKIPTMTVAPRHTVHPKADLKPVTKLPSEPVKVTSNPAPQETPAVGEVFSFGVKSSSGALFLNVFIPCCIFAALVLTMYGGVRGTQYLYGSLKSEIKTRRSRRQGHQTRTCGVLKSRDVKDSHAVVMDMETDD